MLSAFAMNQRSSGTGELDGGARIDRNEIGRARLGRPGDHDLSLEANPPVKPAARKTRAGAATSARTPAKPAAPRASNADLELTPLDRPRVASARAREIYVQASRLFVEKGYAATSMSDIAEAVKITKAGLYHFVKGKEDLLFTIMSFGMDELFDEVVFPARATADPLKRLQLIIRNHLNNIGRVSSKSGNPVTIVADEPSGLGPKKRRIINARKREYFELIRDTLSELKARGDTRPDLDVSVATHCITGAILWMGRWRKPNGKLPLDQIVDQIIATQLKGVLAR